MSGQTGSAPAEPPGARPSRLRQVLPHGVMLFGSVLLYWAATRIDAHTGGGARIGPDAWPKAIIVFMGILCVWEIAKRLLATRTPSQRLQAVALAAASPVEPASPPSRDHPRKLAAGVALVAGYAIAVSWLGFFLTTALFLGAFPWAGGLRRPVLAATLGIAGSFALVVLFMRVAYISLPLGEGPFRALSLALLRVIGVSN